MNSTSLLLLLAMMGTVCGNPLPACPHHCKPAKTYHQQPFVHVSNLQHSSVAPWNLSVNAVEGREPAYIEHAVCKDCTVENMIAKPIYIQIQVYKMIRNSTEPAWCKCPYKLAVGCTCVREQNQ